MSASLTAFAGVLLLAVLLSSLAHRTILSTAALFLVAGFVLGDGVLGVVSLKPGDELVATLAELALFTVLFTDGMRVGWPELRAGGSERPFVGGRANVQQVSEAACVGCAGNCFSVMADDIEGCVQRICVACGDASYIADSADCVNDADLEECACPCGGEEFAAAVGFAFRSDGEVRWGAPCQAGSRWSARRRRVIANRPRRRRRTGRRERGGIMRNRAASARCSAR
ncbi:cation:proton antiporter [Nonomuraea angiospora]|uniref:cation:proton antiporter n=1 Tax=Nonomuraea angiospora TaxID=46172 RepID=UPI0029BC55DA|nr:cation:proton antiporter [Nonomuraea angiospora]MDX3101058.1 cation:proton antiporter [Nonomuraea angiospora]